MARKQSRNMGAAPSGDGAEAETVDDAAQREARKGLVEHTLGCEARNACPDLGRAQSVRAVPVGHGARD